MIFSTLFYLKINMTLTFKYGTMNSAKTANLLMLAHNYKSQNKKIILIKPITDTRFSTDKIESRVITSMTADIVLEKDVSDFSFLLEQGIFCILVDEAQFLSIQNIEGLRNISTEINVICYGLKTDYRSYLFEGSKRLIELADNIEEMTSICVICAKKAIINSKFIIEKRCKTCSAYVGEKNMCFKCRHTTNNIYKNTKYIKQGSSKPDLGAEEKYQSLCWQCWL